jgi:hypothetical protein
MKNIKTLVVGLTYLSIVSGITIFVMNVSNLMVNIR